MSPVPTIEWQVAGACNYDCSYCIQSRRYRRGRPEAAQLEAAIATFARLPGTWELKCSGGEAFAHPLFLERVVPGLMASTSHRIGVLTNFSTTEDALLRFAAATRGRLTVFSASLHLEHTTVEAFGRKARWFVDLLDPGARFVVNQVVRPDRVDEARACRDHLRGLGLRWFPQLLKTKTGVAAYPDADDLRELIGEDPGPLVANVAPSYRGRRCHAGVLYAVVDKDGEAWSCRTAKRHGEGRLGNVFDGTFALRDAPAVCPWDICPCTVPANRGMIEGIA
ncbi:MAG: radical SAM protein [Alphaproteobacteria bacterium]|nr:radical SAM protein [Alphaproteobacteria bacterium]MCB9694550.1 radical SAM protein [Alphaproteobacteria bacterium]